MTDSSCLLSRYLHGVSLTHFISVLQGRLSSEASSAMEGRFRPSTGGAGEGIPYRDSVDMSRWNSRTATVFNVLDKRLESRVYICQHMFPRF